MPILSTLAAKESQIKSANLHPTGIQFDSVDKVVYNYVDSHSPHCKEVFAYKVLHLEPPLNPRGSATSTWIGSCEKACSMMVEMVATTYDGPWQIQEVVFRSTRGHAERAQTVRKGFRRCGLSQLQMQELSASEIDAVLQQQSFVENEERHQLVMLNKESAAQVHPIKVLTEPCCEKNFGKLSDLERAIYTFQFPNSAFRKEKTFKQKEVSESAQSPTTMPMPTGDDPACDPPNQASSLHRPDESTLRGGGHILPPTAEEAHPGPARNDYIFTLRYATSHAAIFVVDSRERNVPTVTKICRTGASTFEGLCSCVHRKMTAKRPLNRAVIGILPGHPLPSTCEHVQELTEHGVAVIKCLQAASCNEENSGKSVIVDDRYVVQHREGTCWSILDKEEIYIVTRFRKPGGIVCKTCTSKICQHGNIVSHFRSEDSKPEFEKLSWLHCDDTGFLCPDTFSQYTPSKDYLLFLFGDTTVATNFDARYRPYYHANSRDEKVHIQGQAVRDCKCKKNNLRDVSVDAIIFDQRGVFAVQLMHKVCSPAIISLAYLQSCLAEMHVLQ